MIIAYAQKDIHRFYAQHFSRIIRFPGNRIEPKGCKFAIVVKQVLTDAVLTVPSGFLPSQSLVQKQMPVITKYKNDEVECSS